MNKNLFYILLLNFSFGIISFEFPTHPVNIGKWNGGSAITSSYQQTNPASLKMNSNYFLTTIKITDNINNQNLVIAKLHNNYIFKFKTSIIDYGIMNDFITQNHFSARDILIGFSAKTIFKNLISIGITIDYLNLKIAKWNQKSLRTIFGLKTHLIDERIGIAFSTFKYFKVNKINNNNDQPKFILGSFYKPLYFPGKIGFDLIKKNIWIGILSLEINLNKYLLFTFGINSHKTKLYTGTILNNLYYGFSSSISLNLNKYNLSIGVRNLGQFGSMTGFSIGKEF